MWRLLLFPGWPLAEIALFVLIGGEIGVIATLLWVVITAFVGLILLRMEAERGAVALRRGGPIGEGELAVGLCRAVAAVLLILPGFLTDAIGLLLLLPPVQKIALPYLGRFMVVRGRKSSRSNDDIVIDGEWDVIDNESRPPGRHGPRRPSGWVQEDDRGQG